MAGPDDDDLRDELLALERRLLERAAGAAALLAPGFVEHGRSGTVYDRDETLAAMARPPAGPAAASIEIADFAVRTLAPDVALATFRTIDPACGPALRVSVWVRRAGAWQIVFHQGTAARRAPARPA